MTIVFGGRSFPLVAVGDAIPQPFVDKALPYFQDCINAYVGAAFAATIRGKVQGQAGELACQEVGRVDVGYQLTKKAFRLPYLCLSLDSGAFSEGTARWDQDATKYELSYILPPLPEETIQEVAVPLLGAVAQLLAMLVKAGGDPNHRDGARVWDESAIVSVRMGAYSLEYLTLGMDTPTAQRFPLLRAEVFVVEQEGFPAGDALTRLDSTYDGAGPDGTFPAIVEDQFTPTLVGRRRTVPAPEDTP